MDAWKIQVHNTDREFIDEVMLKINIVYAEKIKFKLKFT
jgi:hypothetical protein